MSVCRIIFYYVKLIVGVRNSQKMWKINIGGMLKINTIYNTETYQKCVSRWVIGGYASGKAQIFDVKNSQICVKNSQNDVKINIVATRHRSITSYNICPDIHYTKWKFDTLNTIAKFRSVR